MTSAIDQLSAEHGVLLSALACLEQLALSCIKEEHLDAARAKALVALIEEMGCGMHHAFEDELLFPLLEKHGVARECGALGVLAYEHEAFEEALERLNAAMDEAAEGDVWACRSWGRQVDALSHISRGHMAKEDGVLFPFAKANLSAGEDLELLEAMTQLEEARYPGLRQRIDAELPEHLEALGVDFVEPLESLGCPGDPRECPRGAHHETCREGP